MGLRVPEVDQHAIAHVLRYEPAEALHGLGDALLIRGNYFTEVFGVHPCRERSRPHEVREHHRDLTAFGRIALLRGNRCRRCSGVRRSGFLDVIQRGNRAQQQTSMTKGGHSEFLQVYVC
jgi:hypothetical protein